jgi:PAS domain S-box-containing protein
VYGGRVRPPEPTYFPISLWMMSPEGVRLWNTDPGLVPEAVHPDDIDGVLAAIARSVQTGDPFLQHFRVRADDGFYVWVESHALPVRGADGQIERWIGAAAEIGAQLSRVSLREALDSPQAPLGIVIVAPDYRYMSATRSAAALLGLSAAEASGKRMSELDPERWERVRPVYERVFAEGASCDLEWTGMGADGSRCGLAHYYPIRLGDEVVAMGIVTLDISARKRAEDAVAALAEERRVLLDALVRAQERERRRIAADIHADTLQVFAALRLKVEELGHRLRDPANRELLAELDAAFGSATQRLRGLLFELWPPSLERAGLGDVLEQLATRIEADGGPQVRLELSLRRELPLDTRAVVYRVIAEAAANAARHARASRVTISVDERGSQVLAEVNDDGAGFDVDESQFGHYGLREMSERVKAIGGMLAITSAPGAGTTISASVPIPDAAGAPA